MPVGADSVKKKAAGPTVIGDRKQTIRVRRKIQTDNVRFLDHHNVEEPGTLMNEAAMVPGPAVKRQSLCGRLKAWAAILEVTRQCSHIIGGLQLMPRETVGQIACGLIIEFTM